MLECSDLVKDYGTVRAVDGLSLRVDRGEIVGLVGPNGAGKTTTLRCLSGVIPPTSGGVAIEGFDLDEDPIEARRRLAFVPDEPHLFDSLTVRDHLRVLARIYGVRDGQDWGRELLERFDLLERIDAYPSELSRGMKQKLMIAGALLHRPAALILDEPLTGLDPRAMRSMKDTIVSWAGEGTAILVSSHMLHLVEELCRRVCIIHRGRLVVDGTLEEIRSSPRFSTALGLEDIFLSATEDEPAP